MEKNQMGVRESMNNRRGPTVTASIILVIGAVGFMVWNMRGPSTRAANVYYSDDDGKTYFADSVDKIYPFDHNGKPAYRAYVYRCGTGQPFVSYLMRYPDATKAKIAELSNNPASAGELASLKSNGTEVKKPGEGKWVATLGPEAMQITMHPKCPDGSTAQFVEP